MSTGFTTRRDARIISVPTQCLALLVRGCAYVLRDAANEVGYFDVRETRTTATLADAHAELDAALALVASLPPDMRDSLEIRHAMLYAQPTINQMAGSRQFDALLRKLAPKTQPDADDRKRGAQLMHWISEVVTVDDHFFEVMCTRDFVAERAMLLSKSGSCCELDNLIAKLRA